MEISIGSLLKSLRESKKVSIIELSSTLGISTRAIYKVESSKDPAMSTVRKYLAAIGAKENELFRTPYSESNRTPLYWELFEKCLSDNTGFLGGAGIYTALEKSRKSIEQICSEIGIPYSGMERVDYGEFSGKLEDLIVFFRVIDARLSIQLGPDKVVDNRK